MLRSLNTAISGLRAHQTMLDATGNNIANVNTTGYKSATVQFQDTMSQMIAAGAAPDQEGGGTNPAQVGLGVQVAGITTNFTQGAAQATGKATDMMINGDGFFVVSQGGQQLYTRAGAFIFDTSGQLVTPDGAVVQGWAANNGVVTPGGPLSNLSLPVDSAAPARATTRIELGGNLRADAPDGTELVRDAEVFDALGTSTTVTLEFTKGATGWSVSADGGATSTALTFTDGRVTAGASLAVGPITVDLGQVTGYSNLDTLKVTDADGHAAGTLDNFSLAPDGTLVGSYSNGQTQVIGQIALATFDNPAGLEKAGGSAYTASANSGGAIIGAAGRDGMGELTGGALEMSNVDLSLEFTTLITAQRGFQANSRVITTSDEVLGELVNLKR